MTNNNFYDIIKKKEVSTMKIGEEMLRYRQRMGMTQQKCAEACKISIQTWYSVENGRQKPSKLTEGKIRNLIGYGQDK